MLEEQDAIMLDDEDIFAEEETPTTEETSEETTEPEAITPESRKVKVKYNHQEMELDEAEAVPLIQKGLNYDKLETRLKEQESAAQKAESLAKSLGYANTEAMIQAAHAQELSGRVQELVDGGLDEKAAKALAQFQLKEERQQKEAAKQADEEARKENEIAMLTKLYPDVKELPKEVLDAVEEGLPLVAAYQQYLLNEKEKKLQALEQNQKNAEKAPVKGATGYGVDNQKKDPFEEGFDSYEY